MAIQVQMKPRSISTVLFITIAFILIMASSCRVQAQTYTQYKIQLNSDGSATWTITQVSGINGTADTWAGFQEKITALVNAAAFQTNRPMGIDNNSLQMSTVFTSSNSKTTEYTFTWLNFSVTENGRLVAGDVFGVAGFFNKLYGDGELEINYPANYTLESVTPAPDQKDASTQTLEWLGTQFFITEKPSIVLKAQEIAPANSGQQPSYVLLVSVATVAVIAAVIASWFFFINRRNKGKEKPVMATLTLPETEEEKVLRVLRSNGGSAYQSAITEQCRFSKAKTSQLLTALERKGVVRRYKKGRDKIVNLIEQVKGEK
jgi:uncharacterized membrane protein